MRRAISAGEESAPKSKRGRQIPLTARAVEILEPRSPAATTTNSSLGWRRRAGRRRPVARFLRARDHAGLKSTGLTLHDLRHTTGSLLARRRFSKRRSRRCSATLSSPRQRSTCTTGPAPGTRSGCRARSAAIPTPASCVRSSSRRWSAGATRPAASRTPARPRSAETPRARPGRGRPGHTPAAASHRRAPSAGACSPATPPGWPGRGGQPDRVPAVEP